ncbi:MAG: flagellar protein FliS [Clostridium sp.]|nr:flagellar protein FliS [Clostridium sp.]
MQDTLKKDFTLRIAQANRTQLTVIIFEICLSYLEAAIGGTDREENIARARACVDELKESLNFEYELSGPLLHLYIHVNKLLVRAAAGKRTEPLVEAQSIMSRLHDQFSKVSESDDSLPLVQNAQEVYAGYTYGKNDINVNVGGSERGFFA